MLYPGAPTVRDSTVRSAALAPMGDIGCYTLGALPPLIAIDTLRLHGREHRQTRRHGEGAAAPGGAWRVIGDSTFFHSGVTPLIDVVYNDDRARSSSSTTGRRR